MINITLTFLVIGTYPVNWRFETFPETFCECAINNSSSSGWRMCRNLRNNLRDSETLWEREKRKSPSNEWKVREEDRQGRELFLRQTGRGNGKSWSEKMLRLVKVEEKDPVVNMKKSDQECTNLSKKFETLEKFWKRRWWWGRSRGGWWSPTATHSFFSSVFNCISNQVTIALPCCMICALHAFNVAYLVCFVVGFCCAQSMDPICGCVTLFKARAPSDRKVRRQWQLLTVPKHSAQNLTPRIRLNISTSNFSPTL